MEWDEICGQSRFVDGFLPPSAHNANCTLENFQPLFWRLANPLKENSYPLHTLSHRPANHIMLTRLAASLLLGFALIATACAEPAALTGKWLAEDIDGGGVIDRLQTTLEIRDDGIVTGMGGCNRYAGSATVSGEAIKFLPLASTRMACSAAAMRQESRFHATLERVRAWRIDQQQRKLVLLDGGGFDLIRFSRMD
jgi:heat shock protein HslJ